MHYDPIKNSIGKLVKRNTFLRKVFYKVLGIIFLREWYVKKRIREIRQNTKQEDILDAGSGFGQYTYFMSKNMKHANILGVDVKEDQIEDCKYFFQKIGKSKCNFQISDLTKIDFNNQFDFILSVDVMEHIEDDFGVFKRFFKALRKNGRVLINTPSNLGGSDARSDDDDSFIGEHVRTGYSKEDICSKLESAGFQIEYFEYTYGIWGNRYWRLGIKYPMLLLNKSQLFFLILPFYYLITFWWTLLFMLLDINEKDKKTGTGVLVVGKKI
jgi:SAM-dependent methyltransferase